MNLLREARKQDFSWCEGSSTRRRSCMPAPASTAPRSGTRSVLEQSLRELHVDPSTRWCSRQTKPCFQPGEAAAAPRRFPRRSSCPSSRTGNCECSTSSFRRDGSPHSDTKSAIGPHPRGNSRYSAAPTPDTPVRLHTMGNPLELINAARTFR
ncbi:hypothetical protein RHEC894_CH02181 [Rhizobium sp. CIAT894]|nr:hypothetical protein RHEC894_CH02181 [Rhizobium sp. CIAT894]